QGLFNCRRARDDRRGGVGGVSKHPVAGDQAAHLVRSRPWLYPPWSAGDYVVRWRSTAGQVVERAVAASDGSDDVHPGRADDRPAPAARAQPRPRAQRGRVTSGTNGWPGRDQPAYRRGCWPDILQPTAVTRPTPAALALARSSLPIRRVASTSFAAAKPAFAS